MPLEPKLALRNSNLNNLRCRDEITGYESMVWYLLIDLDQVDPQVRSGRVKAFKH